MLVTIVERSRRLCGAQVGQLYLLEGDHLRLSRISGDVPEEFRTYVTEHPIAVDRTSSTGRAAVDRRTHMIPDVLADEGYDRLDLQRVAGYRSLVSTPLILQDEVVGALSMFHPRVGHFDLHDKQLLEEFALQAAIVLRQVQLVQVLESRGAELATKVDQLEVLREVGETVGSSLDLDEVLDLIVTHAVRITGTDGGSIMEYDEEENAFHVRTAYGSSDAMLAQLREVTLRRESTLVGRTALDRRPLMVPDLEEVTLDPHLEILHRNGWRSVLAAPMLRGDLLVGVLVIRRRRPGAFSPDTIELLETLASQSALAILNARLFRELGSKTRELEVVSQHKSEFLASMSHELRTPLNAVIGFSEVLLDRMFGELNERQEDYLQDIRSSGRHLLELLNEILDLSKVEAGQMVLEPTMFSVPAVLEYGLALVRERAASHGISLTVNVGEGVGLIEADELKFKQVLLNLLSNAVKFTPDGGSVSVAASRVGDVLTVTVTDTGVGVPVEDRERIFESFQQGARGTAKEEGTGLGLTLSRRIVELFGGRLWLEPGPGRPGQRIRVLDPGPGPRRGAGERTRDRRGDPHRRRRPRLARPDVGLPLRLHQPRPARPRRAGGPAAVPGGPSQRRRPRHPAAQEGRVGGARGAQAGPGHQRHPGDRRLHRRRAAPRARAGRRGLPPQAGPARPARRVAAPGRRPGSGRTRGRHVVSAPAGPRGGGQPPEPQARP